MSKKESTKNAHIQGIWKAQLYIQKHLNEVLKIEDIAKKAGFSPYHFHRVFKAFVKEPLNEYIRRLRLEKAAGKLKYSENFITDIALDSGYQTPSSFSKAFGKVMGNSPQAYRRKNAGDNISTHIKHKGKNMIEANTVNLPKFEVFFVRAVGPYDKAADEAWSKLHAFMKNHKNCFKESRMFSVAHDDPGITEAEKLRFDACVSVPKEPVDDTSVGKQSLGGRNYAVFIHKGSYDTLNETFDKIFSEWYPDHKDEVVDEPCLCEHTNMELIETNPENLITKIYVPLI